MIEASPAETTPAERTLWDTSPVETYPQETTLGECADRARQFPWLPTRAVCIVRRTMQLPAPATIARDPYRRSETRIPPAVGHQRA
jgi:hypothetical protein